MADRHYFIGIDLGTSSVKIILIDENKKILFHCAQSYAVSNPEFGWREIDPEIWFNSMAKGMDAIFSRYDPRQVDAIGVTGQMHTLVMLGENGEPVRPAIMWDDIRAKNLIGQMRSGMEGNPACEYMLKNISTGSPAANLYWMRRFEPDNFSQIKKILIAPDYLVYRFTGVYGTDYTEASTSCLYDIPARKWSSFMRELTGLDESVYPDVRGSGVIAGNITAAIARRFSMREDVRVITGMGDNPATAISAGCLGQGNPVISMGTSGVLIKPSPCLNQDAKGKMILFSLDGRFFSFLAQGALQSSGGAFKWWINSILGIDDISPIDTLLNAYAAKKNRLIFFPHLMGEKTLFSDPDIRGAFIGLSSQTTREDMLFAVIEGLCFGYRELAEKMGVDLNRRASLRIVGGGARSRVQAQILANVLNVPVEQMDDFAGPTLGIALLAAYSSGVVEDIDKSANNSGLIKAVFEPEPEMIKISGEKYSCYQNIYPALKSIYQ